LDEHTFVRIFTAETERSSWLGMYLLQDVY